MTRQAPATAWWGGLDGPDKFRISTRLTLQASVVAAVVGVTVTGRGAWFTAGLVIAGLATVAAVEAMPDLTDRSQMLRRWAPRAALLALGSVWLAAAVAARVSNTDSTVGDARVTGVFAAMMTALGLLASVRYRWALVVALGVATGLAYWTSPAAALKTAVLTGVLGGFVLATMAFSMWGLQLVDELDRAKDFEAELQVADERLRFSRDLHDVVGRSFSAIAVKSELAATLARAGQVERASDEMDQVKTLAVDSMGEMRTLVREYRDIDLVGEVAGARSLLAAAGCALAVEGDPATVPPRFHEVAAWVMREGTTNIVRHSSATNATLALGPAGMSLRNDGAAGVPGRRSGLNGLAERLAAIGGTLDAAASDDHHFVLEARWEAR